MNAQMSTEEVIDTVRVELAKRMRTVLEMNLTADEKVSRLSAEFYPHSVVEGVFSTERQIFVGIPAMSFVGTIMGVQMTISVC